MACKKNERLTELVNSQTHRHAKPFRKLNQNSCRFGFPLPPLDKTCILCRLENDHPDRSFHESNYKKIMKYLENFKLGYNIDSDLSDLLTKLSLSPEQYILALRSGIYPGKCKLFLKRDMSGIRIYSYNKLLLQSWKANMDIQYILDPYACDAYIVSYVSKGQRGMSNVLMHVPQHEKKKMI